MVVKDNGCLLDFGAYKGATEFGGALNSDPDTCTEQMRTGREGQRIFCDAAYFHDAVAERWRTTRS